ncbi:MAG: 23S rRNA (adenine(2503)-C(2))-methyltransferase RlmN [Rhabdochlamydiaceae bacterium]
MSTSSIHGLTKEDLLKTLVELGEKPFRYAQIMKWVYEKGVLDWDKMTDLNKSSRTLLSQHLSLRSLSLVKVQESSDGETTKYLWSLPDGKLVESVLIKAPDRLTVCVSSQVGCPARCAFCASGKKGLIRNLSAEEIHEQVVLINADLKAKGERVSHVVYMGMGEPFENYGSVMKSIKLLIDPDRLNLSQRRITVSTVGVVEGILRMAKEGLSVSLVLSLHAPNQKVRQKIIPYARKYPLDEILKAMRFFGSETKRDITYEYTLIKGINDKKEDALELADLLKGHRCTVNLIPYNPVEGLLLKRPEKNVIEIFKEILQDEGINTTWRYTKGKDIAAACGQLALQESV